MQFSPSFLKTGDILPGKPEIGYQEKAGGPATKQNINWCRSWQDTRHAAIASYDTGHDVIHLSIFRWGPGGQQDALLCRSFPICNGGSAGGADTEDMSGQVGEAGPTSGDTGSGLITAICSAFFTLKYFFFLWDSYICWVLNTTQSEFLIQILTFPDPEGKYVYKK